METETETEITIHQQSFEKDFDDIDYYPHTEEDTNVEDDKYGYYK